MRENINGLLEQCSLTNAEICQKLNMDPTTFYKKRTGRLGVSLDDCELIAGALGVTAGNLMTPGFCDTLNEEGKKMTLEEFGLENGRNVGADMPDGSVLMTKRDGKELYSIEEAVIGYLAGENDRFLCVYKALNGDYSIFLPSRYWDREDGMVTLNTKKASVVRETVKEFDELMAPLERFAVLEEIRDGVWEVIR